MKRIERSPFRADGQAIALIDRLHGIWKFGLDRDLLTREVPIAGLDVLAGQLAHPDTKSQPVQPGAACAAHPDRHPELALKG